MSSSINNIIHNSLTGLFVNQAALSVTSNNVANVNTPGYARQVVQQEAFVTGTQSGGVRISGIDRVIDRFLVRATYDANADFGRYQVENAFHERIQSFLGKPDENTSLSGKIDDLFTAISELALDPSSTILRENSLSKINNFGEEVGYLAESIQNLRKDASDSINDKIAEINALLERIDNLNPLIVRETVTNGTPGSLLEQRAQAIGELSELIDISITDTGNNGIQITTSTGITLVGQRRVELQYEAPGSVTTTTRFPSITIHPVNGVTGAVMPSTATLDGEVFGGELKGLLKMRDEELPEIAAQLGNLAAAFADEINRVHNTNSAVPAPNSLSGINTGLLGGDLHNFTGDAVFAVTDVNGDLVNSVTIDFDALAGGTLNDVITAVNAALGPAATLSLNNGVMSFSAANPAHGVAIAQSDSDPSLRAGRGFSHFFGLNDLVQANTRSHFQTGVAGAENHGFGAGQTITFEVLDDRNVSLDSYTLTIAGSSFDDLLNDLNASPLSNYATFSLSSEGEFTMTPLSSGQALSLQVKNDTTSRGATGVSLSHFFGIGERFVMDAAFGLKVKDEIFQDAGLFALARFDQSAAIGDNVFSIGDQSGARAFQDLENLVVSFREAGGLSAMNVTLGQYGANILADLGLRASMAAGFAGDSASLKNQLEQKSADISGVNLDEELSNMVIYQNAYSASARILQTAQDIYDALLSVV
ncbi:flagellar hook-associated protein FlgK [Luteithermobacter gelatinilyticus]|uniref:flagellar hook-associated protein FlgK n=1 Tax=Luteithermobacter gelatinilyticus TaxID=2582913 RepID=UPI0011067B80|nr:flagellar hook-associated protein FlgK [Luteithermobacter gelatinilyticus]